MRLILKLVAATVALALTVAGAVFAFVLSVSEVFFGIASSIIFIASMVLLFTGEPAGGIAWLAAAFLISPFGLPAFAGWLVSKLDDLGYALKSFIFN